MKHVQGNSQKNKVEQSHEKDIYGPAQKVSLIFTEAEIVNKADMEELLGTDYPFSVVKKISH